MRPYKRSRFSVLVVSRLYEVTLLCTVMRNVNFPPREGFSQAATGERQICSFKGLRDFLRDLFLSPKTAAWIFSVTYILTEQTGSARFPPTFDSDPVRLFCRSASRRFLLNPLNNRDRIRNRQTQQQQPQKYIKWDHSVTQGSSVYYGFHHKMQQKECTCFFVEKEIF